MRIQVLTVPEAANRVKAKDRESFAKHAAPRAIQAQIVSANRRLRAAQEELIWLRDLQAKRATQVLRGEWPYNPQGETRKGRS